MSAASDSGWVHQQCDIGSGVVSYRKKGTGPALWYLPRDNGYPPTTTFMDELARSFTVYAPWLPGYTGGKESDWTWASAVRDLAVIVGTAVRKTGTEDAVLLGFGFGGWLGAEMLCADPTPFSRAVLVSPMGVRPKEGVLFDQFLVNAELYARRMFFNEDRFLEIFSSETPLEQLEAWEDDREMTCRVAWKPHMHNPSLPHMLQAISVPVTLVHGENDRIVPVEVSEMISRLLQNSSIVRIPECGHAAELEHPNRVRSAVG